MILKALHLRKSKVSGISLLILSVMTFSACENSSSTTHIQSDENTAIDNSMVAWWKFDEGNGIQAVDSSGHGNTATISRGSWSPGKIHTALQMDGGNDDIVTVPLSESLRSTTDNITVMAWTYRTAEHNVDVIGHGYPYLFFGFHGAQFKWQIMNTRGNKVSCYADPAYKANLNQWFHLAGTYDGKTARLYVDGKEIFVERQWFSAPIEMPETPFTISGYFKKSGIIVDEITGKIDDVRIYNRVLTNDEIGLIYTAGLNSD